ncbi:MAG: S9 family peptidase [Candidatus Marinimicrobia bacterium CG08_land_8_20_14_0_20_45_22]|nr:MAG: S9 family peptidase [Candidatus Marinimicrobia bacterium CG08_land_8_20_14_0_20_45_22]
MYLKTYLITFIMISAAVSAPIPKRALTIDDLLACQRVLAPQFSPDGKRIAFALTSMSVTENKSHTELWSVGTDGNGLKQMTSHTASSTSPLWSPDGKKLAFLSARSGVMQIWILPSDGGKPEQLTTHFTGVNDFVWSNDGQYIAFSSRVYPDSSDQKTAEERDKATEQSLVKARVYDDLMFRHWDEWWDHKRSHLFVLDVQTREFTDVTPGNFDAPPIALGEGYTFSPDSKELVFTSNHEPVVAISTNNDIWSVPVSGGTTTLITSPVKDRDFKGNDQQPKFSADGKYLAFLSMKRAGYEADKKDLFLKNLRTGELKNITEKIDISVSTYQWLPVSENLILEAEQEGRDGLFLLDIRSLKLKPIVSDGANSSVTVSPDGKSIAYLHQITTMPNEICITTLSDGKSKQLTNFNSELLADVDMNPIEDFRFISKDKTQIHGFLIKPPHFDKTKKYPMVMMVHGGPQGQWNDSWHYRWNLQLWAAQGIVIVAINPRGSTGYGQKFTEAISLDWGGKPFEDLVAGEKYVIENFAFIDKERLAAAGASYGGYMMNWMEGHMDDFKYPFKTLVNHDGSFNLYAMYLTTEELWFPEWEYGGVFWNSPEQYEKYSCDNYIKNFKTPMLVIHGEKDYRLDFSQGLMVFTSLRRMGVPAKLVLFPDEGHWVLKPHNSRFWHQTVFEWLKSYLQ